MCCWLLGYFVSSRVKGQKKEQLTFLMKEWTRKEILFHDRAVFTIQGKDTLDKFPYASTYYKIVTYVDSLGCLSCKLQLLERINFIAEVDSVTSRNVSFYFFFHPRNRKELIMTLQSEDFIYPVCIDLKDTFNKLNKFPLNDKFRTFLLDNTNKVILVGNPMHHPRIKEMYMGQLRDCNNKPEVEGDE